jgi:hypothetical protein
MAPMIESEAVGAFDRPPVVSPDRRRMCAIPSAGCTGEIRR